MIETQAYEGMYVQDDGIGPVLEILRLYNEWINGRKGVLCAEVGEIEGETNDRGEYIDTFNISVDSLTVY